MRVQLIIPPLQKVLNAAARLIPHKRKYDHIASEIRDRLHLLPAAAACGAQDLPAVVSSADGISLPYSDERPGFCLRQPKSSPFRSTQWFSSTSISNTYLRTKKFFRLWSVTDVIECLSNTKILHGVRGRRPCQRSFVYGRGEERTHLGGRQLRSGDTLANISSRLSFQPTPSNLSRRPVFKFHWSNKKKLFFTK